MCKIWGKSQDVEKDVKEGGIFGQSVRVGLSKMVGLFSADPADDYYIRKETHLENEGRHSQKCGCLLFCRIAHILCTMEPSQTVTTG